MKRKREAEEEKEESIEGNEKWNILFQTLEGICKTNKLLKDFLVEELEKETEKNKRAAKKPNRSRSPRRSRSPIRKKEEFVDDKRRIVLDGRRTPLSELKAKYGSAIDVIDVSKEGDYNRLHPAFPLDDIPIPGNTNDQFVGVSVMGIYEGLKVFEKEKISKKSIGNPHMRVNREPNDKRGKLLGYSFGLRGSSPKLDEKEAREKIFLPTYKYALENNEDVKDIIAKLKAKLDNNPNLRLVIVDTKNANVPINDLTKPISHGWLLRDFLEGNYPETIEE